MSRRPLLTILFACLALPVLSSLSAAQTMIRTNMSETQIRNIISGAGAGSTIRFENGTFNVKDLRPGSNNVTIEGSGNTTLNGQNRGGPIITVLDKDDVRIRNLNLRGAQRNPFNGAIFGRDANRLIVENCDIQVERTQGGVYLQRGGGQIIRNNRIYNPRAIDYEFPADLLYFQNTNSNGWLVEGNTLNAQGRVVERSSHRETLDVIEHIDNIQTQNCQGGTINANTFTIDVNIEQHFHAVLIGGTSGNGTHTYTISNNYMVNNFPGNQFSDKQDDFILGLQGSSNNRHLVYHNTIVGNGEQLMWVKDTNSNSEFRNNIFYRRQTGRGPIVGVVPRSNIGRWGNNLYYNQSGAGSDVISANGSFRTLSEFQNFSGSTGSIVADPRFVVEGPDVLSGSPAINAGTFLAAIGDDLDGNSRGGTPTIGAIEFGGSGSGGGGSESITLDGPVAIPPSGSEPFMIDYDVNGTRDITLTIFEVVDGNYIWKAARRIENVSGAGTWMGELSYPNISTSTVVIKAALLPDGGNWMDSLQDEFLDVDIISSQPESITLDGPDAIEPSGSGTFTVDYNVNQPRDITVTVFEVVNGNYTWKGARRVENVSGSGTTTVGVSYANISTSTAVIKAALLPDGGNWMDSLQDEFLNVDVGTVPESISVQGPTVVGSSGTETYTIDYQANGTRDLTIDIFEINNGQWNWKAQRRIENVSGGGSTTVDLTYPNISTPIGAIKVSLLPDGGNWMESLIDEFLNIQIE